MTGLASVLLAATASAAPLPYPVLRDRRARTLDCSVLDATTASERFPGRVSSPRPRGDYLERTVLACAEHLLRPGLRSPREAAVLSRLQPLTTSIAQRAAVVSTLSDRTWLVEANDVSAPLTAKVRFATQNALMAAGLAVSDRLPSLGPADARVLGPRSPLVSWPAACVRLHQTGALDSDDALLVVTPLDARQTTLQAGVCADGQWSWLP